MKTILLNVNGVLNALLCILHMSFWQLFDWEHQLSGLARENRAILEILNIVSIWIILYFTIICFWFAKRAQFTMGEKSILILMAGFYLIRLVTGYPYFGFDITELIVWIVCALIITGCLIPVFAGSTSEQKAITIKKH